MAFIKRSELLSYPVDLKKSLTEKQAATVTAFLSHSHHDQSLVGNARSLLRQIGVSSYVDWLDGELPAVTNAHTAVGLKKMIDEADRFVVLATQQALASHWVPWELGYADKAKGTDNIALFIVQEDVGSFSGNEYMRLYATIEKGDDGTLGVFPAGKDQGPTLQTWFHA